MAQREQDTLEGVIESIVYKNEENGYTIASVLLDDGGMTTILGSLPFLGAGEHISATGSYSIHPQHGPQFQVESYYREMPEEEEGIYAYLASRVIRGVGPKTAGLIVSRFGRDSFRVLAEEPEKLACVKGITLARAREIQQEFLRLNAMRVLLEFLAERGVSMAAATSSPREHVTAALDRLGLLPYLKAVFTTGEVGVSKHEPVIYHLAAEALGTAPAETLVFEDSLYALKTAKTAGFRTVGVLDAHGETDQAGLKEAAEVYLTSLTEFPGHWEPLNK